MFGRSCHARGTLCNYLFINAVSWLTLRTKSLSHGEIVIAPSQQRKCNSEEFPFFAFFYCPQSPKSDLLNKGDFIESLSYIVSLNRRKCSRTSVLYRYWEAKKEALHNSWRSCKELNRQSCIIIFQDKHVQALLKVNLSYWKFYFIWLPTSKQFGSC